MKLLKHILLIDPIAFNGGSKTATKNILEQLQGGEFKLTIVTARPNDWLAWSQQIDNCSVAPLWELPFLAKAEQGLSYFARHLLIFLQLCIHIFIKGKVDVSIGCSGPGVDLSLYLLKRCFKQTIIQLIQGPVAASKTIAKCLSVADNIVYLASCRPSIIAALNRLHSSEQSQKHLQKAKYHYLKNGLTRAQWPTPKLPKASGFFWAASLLKWKGLDVLSEALAYFSDIERPVTSICYIPSKHSQLPTAIPPKEMAHVDCISETNYLDNIRCQRQIFISTSIKEPFGLSILEAMAAGLCIVIPDDGAYWDQVLKHNVNCIKYRSQDPQDLFEQLQILINDTEKASHLGKQAMIVAENYRAEKTYAPVANLIQSMCKQATLVKQG